MCSCQKRDRVIQHEVIHGFLGALNDPIQTEGRVTIPTPAACALQHSQIDL